MPSDKPALITDAQRSPAEQMRSRQIRYGVMMGIRAILLIVATVLVMAEVPLMWLWLSVCALGMVILPWTAVLVANDRLPKEEHRISRWRPFARRAQAGPSEVESATSSVVIDADSQNQASS